MIIIRINNRTTTQNLREKENKQLTMNNMQTTEEATKKFAFDCAIQANLKGKEYKESLTNKHMNKRQLSVQETQ